MAASQVEIEEQNRIASDSTLSLDEVLDDAVSEIPPNIPDMEQLIGMTAVGDSIAPEVEYPQSPASSKRGRGRPKKTPDQAFTGERPTINGAPKKERPQTASQASPVDLENAGIEPCAQMAVMMVNASGMMLGGEEAAMQPHEVMLSKDAFVQYFKMKGVDAVPAWVILVGGLAPYYLRILTQTPARSTVPLLARNIWEKTKSFFRKRRDARSNRRYNGQREDNRSDAAS